VAQDADHVVHGGAGRRGDDGDAARKARQRLFVFRGKEALPLQLRLELLKGDLQIANAGAGVATVAATTDLDMGTAAVDLRPGGALAAGDGGTLNITNATISFNGGSINGSGSGIVNVKDGFAFGSGTNTFSGRVACWWACRPSRRKGFTRIRRPRGRAS
jgi:hypothetical protein